MRSTARISDAIRSPRKALVIAGTAAALLGAGAGTASAATTAAPVPAVEASHQSADAFHMAATPVALLDAAVAKAAASVGRPASHAAAHQVPAVHTKARRAAQKGPLPAADQLRPVAVFGPQQYMQLTPAQVANARTIVKQTLVKKMGVRSAVIAVATAMQESQLNNINYGTSDSLGLFQQRPSCGWGTPQQIMDPTYAANAFLNALKVYQGNNPGWATQPLYQAAQGVQGSAFPSAYAKWEAQAAGLVQQVTTHLTR